MLTFLRFNGERLTGALGLASCKNRSIGPEEIIVDGVLAIWRLNKD